MIKNAKDTVPWTYMIEYLDGDEIRMEYSIKKKGKNNLVNGKDFIIYLKTVELLLWKLNIDLFFSNHAAKSNANNATGFDAL